MILALFANINQALFHAKDHGGWIAVCNDRSVYWFQRFAKRAEIIPIVREHGGGEFGGWALFDDEEKHFLQNVNREVVEK